MSLHKAIRDTLVMNGLTPEPHDQNVLTVGRCKVRLKEKSITIETKNEHGLFTHYGYSTIEDFGPEVLSLIRQAK